MKMIFSTFVTGTLQKTFFFLVFTNFNDFSEFTSNCQCVHQKTKNFAHKNLCLAHFFPLFI